MAVSAALIAEQRQVMPVKPERHTGANPPLRHLMPVSFLSQKQEAVRCLFFTVLSKEEPRAVPGLPYLLLAEPAVTSYTH